MNQHDHILRLRDACEGLDKHCAGNGAAWTALHDLELDIYELDKAFEQQIEDEKEKPCSKE